MITIRVQATGRLLTDPHVAERFDGEIASTLAELGTIGQRLVVSETPRGVSSGSGGLRGSIITELQGTPARRQAIVTSSLFYAPIVEVGRRPGRRPPMAALRLWVARKLSVPADRVDRVAFLVARKIGERGTTGAHMFERGANRLVAIAQQKFTALQERLALLLGGR